MNSELTELWDKAVAEFLAGGPAVPSSLSSWASSYRGMGRGEVVLDAFPEPFLGDVTSECLAAFLALNPGQAHLHFQGRDGLFADEIRSLGSYSSWAKTWPYLRDPWIDRMGVNRHHASRLRFLRSWFDAPSADGGDMVAFELYPWHSTAVTGSMRPPREAIERYVWTPLRALGVPVFAFGAPWFSVLQNDLRLPPVDVLGPGGRPYGSAVASRSVTVFKSGDVTVIAERHLGSAGPPSYSETMKLRDAVSIWI